MSSAVQRKPKSYSHTGSPSADVTSYGRSSTTFAPMCSNVGSTSESSTALELNSLQRTVSSPSSEGEYRLIIGPSLDASSSILPMSSTAERALQSDRYPGGNARS